MRNRHFPAAVLEGISEAVAQSETRHRGEIRFAVEPVLPPFEVLAGKTGAERAVEVFSSLRVWDTEENSGVLLYVLLADRDVEIVADRGIHRRVGKEGWEAICHLMEGHFREGRFLEGAVAGIEAVGTLLELHFPPTRAGAPENRPDLNELPDAPALL